MVGLRAPCNSEMPCNCCVATSQAIPELQKVIPVRRARMRLKLQVPSSAEHELEQLLRKEDAVIENQSAMQAQVLRRRLHHPDSKST